MSSGTRKPIFLAADSQILFGEDGLALFMSRVRKDIQREHLSAAYLGASNGDRLEYFAIFEEAMRAIGILNCRMILSRPLMEDVDFLEKADLILLAGGDVEAGWAAFEKNGLRNLLPRKYYDGTILIGVSAGAVQLGRGWLPPEGTHHAPIKMLDLVPFYVGAHEEGSDWANLRACLALAQEDAMAIGVPFGGGATYSDDGVLEPLRKPMELLTRNGKEIKNELVFELKEPLAPDRS